MGKNKNLYAWGFVLAAALLAVGAIIYSQKQNSHNQPPGETAKNAQEAILKIKPDDHILGSPQAEISLIEYSDIECPYCRSFHVTMQKLMADYGQTGKLNWVYRHFPLISVHPTAMKQAEAVECAAEMGGNDKFWSYLDKLVATSISKNNTEADLAGAAEESGLNKDAFAQCLKNGKYAQKIRENSKEAETAGAQGTPFSILKKGNNSMVIPGALPYETMKGNVEQLLKN